MVILEAAAIGAAGYGVYRGGEAVARKGQATLKEHRLESRRRGQRKELEQKAKDRKEKMAQLNMMRGGSASSAAPSTSSATTSLASSSSSSMPSTSSSSSSVLDRMRADHANSSKGGGRFKSLFKKK